MKRTTPDPWSSPGWSEPGHDVCEFCRHAFWLEIGYYCADCDRAVCPVCVVALRERQAVGCPGCFPGERA